MDQIEFIKMENYHWEMMREHIISCLPEEACGLLGGRDGFVSHVIPVTNLLHSPFRFRMDPEEQLAAIQKLEALDSPMIGIYHSHVHGPEGPSATDLEEAYYPKAAYLIWFPYKDNWQCRAYQLKQDGLLELPLMIISE